MKNKILKLFAAICIIMPLSGCFGNEPNDVAYIVALGFDKADDNVNYKITVQFAKPTQISGGASESGGKAGADIIENITVEAPNIYAGINTVNHIVSKKFSLYHTKLFVFSREVAQEGVGDLLETMSRSEEIRPDVYIAVSLGSANEYLTAVKPVVELNPAKYYQLTYDKNDSAGFPRCTLQDFYFLENINYSDVAVPLAGVMKSQSENSGEQSQGGEGKSQGKSKSGGEDEQSDSSQQSSNQTNTPEKSTENEASPINNGGFEYKIRNYIAGQVAVEEENKSETMGMAVFSGQKMVGVLGGIDSVIYNILKGEYRGSYVTFAENGTDGAPVTVKMNQKRKPLINIDIKNKKINIKIYLESDFYSLSSNYVLEKEIGDFEKTAAKEIEGACTAFITNVRDSYDSDIIGLGINAKRKFLTNKNFDEYNWREKFKEYEITVNADFNVRRTGLTMRER